MPRAPHVAAPALFVCCLCIQVPWYEHIKTSVSTIVGLNIINKTKRGGYEKKYFNLIMIPIISTNNTNEHKYSHKKKQQKK